MPSKLNPSSLSLVALFCGTAASAIIALDPWPHGHPKPVQSAVLLIAPAGASPAVDAGADAATPAADRDFDMP